MGYGFLRAIYGQKPKKPYAYLKSLYGEQLEKHLMPPHITAKEDIHFTDEEWKEFRKAIKRKVRHENRARVKAMLISLILTIIVMAALVWLIREWIGF